MTKAKKQKLYTVYGLVDSKNVIRYVGFTGSDLRKRLGEHESEANGNNLKPVYVWLRTHKAKIVTLETYISRDDAKEREEFWIEGLAAIGSPILNIKTCNPGQVLSGLTGEWYPFEEFGPLPDVRAINAA